MKRNWFLCMKNRMMNNIHFVKNMNDNVYKYTDDCLLKNGILVMMMIFID